LTIANALCYLRYATCTLLTRTGIVICPLLAKLAVVTASVGCLGLHISDFPYYEVGNLDAQAATG
jgi:hypothetical protein